MALRKNINGFVSNLIGKPIFKKVVIIESDDWGTIRMSSKKAFESLKKKGYPVDHCSYNKSDALESNQDLENLFEVLNNIKGNDGNPAVMTANNIVANPDFEKIKDSNFQEYYFEPFTETLKRYPKHDNVMELYQQGINAGLVMPQFHGREHLNVTRWMNALRNNAKAEKDAFDNNVFSPKISQSKGYPNEYMDALDFNSKSELIFQEKSIIEGLDLFEKIWGFRSKSFIAPCYIWHSDLEMTLSTNGVKYFQGLVNQLQPKDGDGFEYKKIYHYQGQKNKHGQRYFIRNAFFEPTIEPDFDWESDCLRRIKIAFSLKKPAIISSHRLNYIGFLNPSNRESNLKRLQNLLFQIKKTWPEVQFMSTDQLGLLYDT
ncbi:hypothetical protein MM213_01090 [Belliella sp. R4-6]|uniref:Polysaccharide (De)acetylase n=1 Tax=Belliella alkalica TaxID=1730871 RepID=A0ABS9V6M5_9BACT|nr:hypothetical protein [Belliella alkalica]MCH7412061.1 hypothetical protein [Belliella alkalica]